MAAGTFEAVKADASGSFLTGQRHVPAGLFSRVARAPNISRLMLLLIVINICLPIAQN